MAKKRKKKQKGMIKRQRQNKPKSYLTDAQILKIGELLEQNYNARVMIGFYLCLISGQKFCRLGKIKWDSYNARLAVIRMEDKTLYLPEKLNKKILKERSKARSETSRIMPIKYSVFWNCLETLGVKMSIKKLGVLKLRHTFCRRHYARHQSKFKLKCDLGIQNMRYLPADIFEAKKEPLFNDIL